MARKKRTAVAAAAVEPAALPQKRPGPPGGQRDQNRREKVQRLADAALKLFLERGIEGTRIDEITEAAGVAKGSFYRYFTDKTQLVETIYRPITEAVTQALERCDEALRAARDREALVAAYTRVGLELGMQLVTHAPAIRLYLQERRAPAVGARAPLVRLAELLEQRAESLSVRARESGLLRDYPPPRIASLAVIGAAEALIHAYFTGVDLGNPIEVPAMVTSLIMDGVRPREGS